MYYSTNLWRIHKRHSGGSRPGHKVSGTWSKFPNLNENGQKSHFLRGFSDSEPGQHFVEIRHCVNSAINISTDVLHLSWVLKYHLYFNLSS